MCPRGRIGISAREQHLPLMIAKLNNEILRRRGIQVRLDPSVKDMVEARKLLFERA